jgi:hypothetical protein
MAAAVHTHGVRLAVVPGRSRIDLTARPALPGVRFVVDAVDGALARPDGPSDAVLTLHVRALTDADPPAVTLPSWLADGNGTATVEAPIAAATVDGDRVQARVAVRAGEHVAVVSTDSRCRPVPVDELPGDLAGELAGSPERDGSPTAARSGDGTGGRPRGPVEVVGTAVLDLRGLGFGLPPLVTYGVQVRWRLLLVPVVPSAGPPAPVDPDRGARDREGNPRPIDGAAPGDAAERSRSGRPAH